MKLAEAYVDITARTSRFGRALVAVRRQLVRGLRRMTTSIRRWAPRVGLALAGAFTAVVLAATRFEKQMANVSTMLTETTMPAMRGFEKGIKRLAVEFGQSTETLSKGLYDILSASIAAGNAMGVLEISSRAAIAGITDTAAAVDVITTVLNSYQLSASEANRVSDALFATVKAGKLTFADLARFLGMVAAPAAASGASMEELFAAIATLTRAGVRPRIAMTGMRQAFMAFAKSTPDAIKAAEAFGLSLTTDTLKTIGLTGVLEKLKGATTEQVAAMFSSVEAYNAVITLLGDTEGMARDLASQMKASGSTMDAFNKMAATMSFWFGRLKQNILILAIDIGDMFLPALKKISKYILDNKDKIKDFVVNGLGWFWNNTLRVISKVEFAFRNWSDIVDLAMDTASFASHQFVEDIKHWFTVKIPAYFSYGLNLMNAARKDAVESMGEWMLEQEDKIRHFLGLLTDEEFARNQEWIEGIRNAQSEVTKIILSGVTANDRVLSAYEKAQKASLAKRLKDLQSAEAKQFAEKYKALLFTVKINKEAEEEMTEDAEKENAKRTAASRQAARGEAAFIGLEQAWKQLQLGALNMAGPKVGAGAPGKIQEKQLTEQQKTTKAVQTLPDRLEKVLTPLILSPAPLG